MSDERTQLLLQRYFDQMLTVEERTELSSTLLASARAREDFWEFARWNALIRQWGEAEWGRRDAESLTLRPLPAVAATPVPVPARKVIRFPQPSVRFGAIALAVAAAVALFVSIPALLRWNAKVKPASVAVLTHSADAVWAESGGTKERGESLTPGWLRLKSGAVQIEFSRGARVVLEGPAELQILNDNEAFLRTGKLRAQVPEPAHGFTVRTPEFTVVDYGTEFGCNLAGASELHVFNGLVGLQEAGAEERKLRQNQAVEIDHDQVHEIPARRDQFLSDDELARRERESVQGRLTAWRAASKALSEHPDALLHLDFEGDRGWSRNITNRAWRAIPGAPASMVGCQFTDGRWPGKGAIEFNRPDDRLRTYLPGGYGCMTLMAWVRVDSLPDRPQSLVMGDGMATGDVQWYIGRSGELGFGVHIGKVGDQGGWRFHQTQPVFTPENLGTWICVASVYDNNTDTVTQYVNGMPVGADHLGVRTLLQLETFEVGNWALRDGEQWHASVVPRSARDMARNLQGRIDELAILSAPLSAAEIQQFFEVGRVDRTASDVGPLVKNTR